MSPTRSLGSRRSALCRAVAKSEGGFTLIELLVVVAIIVVLIGMAFPAYQGVQERAKRVMAKNDLTQIATAANAYFTEYGKYPIPASQQGSGEDFTYSYDGNPASPNSDLIKLLENEASKSADNPRGIVFLNAQRAKQDGGYGVQAATAATNPYLFLDPWGRAYSVCIDSDYNGKVRERGTGNLIPFGVTTWSLGKNGDWDKSGIASWK
jgi:prepilin-type N-terminal cleavage/methylation domain-containing protein